MTLAVVATLCAGVFAGAAIYVSVAEHPARLSLGTAHAVRQFGPSYGRGAVMQASLAMIGLFAAVSAWWLTGHLGLLAGGLLLGAVVPFTLLVIKPTNDRLLAPDLDPESEQAAAALRRWGWLHAVRSVLGLLAFGTLLICVAAS